MCMYKTKTTKDEKHSIALAKIEMENIKIKMYTKYE